MTKAKSMLTRTAVLAGIVFNLGLVSGIGSTAADAQVTYACPPGYYFLANYGCYPFGGYTTYAAPYPPPPAYTYYPPYPYAYYPQPEFGLSFRFGDRDRDRGEHDFHRH